MGRPRKIDLSKQAVKRLKKVGSPTGLPTLPPGAAKEVREMLRESLLMVGGPRYLAQRAMKNPAAYLMLLAKLIPSEVATAVQVNTHGEGPTQINFTVAEVKPGDF